ncbi:hypothetical protein ACOPYF_004858, partial [Klebsiella pneumoniae]|nr:hypothetical protein [Klebsiella pneumoniae]HDX8837886.1 hypothetical protein [Klebsiella oxytoca]HBY1682208.1 hypothetical protein [Klebsiella pneumoniae]HBZ0021001.1 hypothetical protein [Klebsiella pneumoniae]HBZ0026511.1 hypothetical protein [Klebsiella pneumoniae]
MSKVHCISGITWKNSDSASFKVYASIAAVFSLGLVTATVRNYEILQLTVPYTWYVFFTAFWLLFPSFTVSFREREGRLFTSMGFYGLKLFTLDRPVSDGYWLVTMEKNR